MDVTEVDPDVVSQNLYCTTLDVFVVVNININ